MTDPVLTIACDPAGDPPAWVLIEYDPDRGVFTIVDLWFDESVEASK